MSFDTSSRPFIYGHSFIWQICLLLEALLKSERQIIQTICFRSHTSILVGLLLKTYRIIVSVSTPCLVVSRALSVHPPMRSSELGDEDAAPPIPQRDVRLSPCCCRCRALFLLPHLEISSRRVAKAAPTS